MYCRAASLCLVSMGSLSTAATLTGLILTGSNSLSANPTASIGPAANSTGSLAPTAASYVGINRPSFYPHGLYWPLRHFCDASTGSIAPKETSVTS